jgi:ABC-type glycerol-3-phosphate transport system permease component
MEAVELLLLLLLCPCLLSVVGWYALFQNWKLHDHAIILILYLLITNMPLVVLAR